MMKYSGRNGSYVTGDITFHYPKTLYLYLGGKGEDQTSIDDYTNPTPGGWNFGGNGSIDKADEKLDPVFLPPENGAGGGGAVDLRLIYLDINKPFENSALMNSLKSRIIVAGSGGGAVSDTNRTGFPGGTITALNNGEHMFGGTQTEGLLGKGMSGIDSYENQGGTGGCGSGYHGGFHNFSLEIKGKDSFESGGSGGSSYISGHPGCISPHYPENTIADRITPFHESKLYFTHTDMKSGIDLMPDSFSFRQILGHVGNGVCRITFLTDYNCQTNIILYSHHHFLLMNLILIGFDVT